METLAETIRDVIQQEFIDQTQDKAYYSEAAVQLTLAMELLKTRVKEVIPEYLVPPTQAPELESDMPKRKRDYIDLLALDGDTYTAIEIKYKTVSNRLDGFHYRNQGAQNNGKFDFVADIARCEKFVSGDHFGPDGRPISKGIAILLTNDKTYWRKARSDSHVKVFDLNAGRRIEPGDMEARWKDRGVVTLRNPYELDWFPPGDNPSTGAPLFRCCLVEISKSSIA
jgi:hypothetical protein